MGSLIRTLAEAYMKGLITYHVYMTLRLQCCSGQPYLHFGRSIYDRFDNLSCMLLPKCKPLAEMTLLGFNAAVGSLICTLAEAYMIGLITYHDRFDYLLCMLLPKCK